MEKVSDIYSALNSVKKIKPVSIGDEFFVSGRKYKLIQVGDMSHVTMLECDKNKTISGEIHVDDVNNLNLEKCFELCMMFGVNPANVIRFVDNLSISQIYEACKKVEPISVGDLFLRDDVVYQIKNKPRTRFAYRITINENRYKNYERRYLDVHDMNNISIAELRTLFNLEGGISKMERITFSELIEFLRTKLKIEGE